MPEKSAISNYTQKNKVSRKTQNYNQIYANKQDYQQKEDVHKKKGLDASED